LNGINSIPNFMKIYQAVQKLLVGDTEDRQTDRQTDRHTDTHTHTHTHTHTQRQTVELISLLSFLESRLKTVCMKRLRAD
jgi:hypothetical protein